MKKKPVKKKQKIRELTANDMVRGIGRKATDEEMMMYLLKDAGKPILLEDAFASILLNSNLQSLNLTPHLL